MTRLEQRWAVRTLDAMAPDLAGAPRPSQIGADVFLREFLSLQPRSLRFGLRVLLVLFALLPLVVVGRPRLFFNLAPELRERYFGRWYKSPVYVIRQLALSLKSLVGIHWCGHPEVQKLLGYRKANALPPVDVGGAS